MAAGTQPQKFLTYRQLFSSLSSSSDNGEKTKAITEAYLKLRKHFEKIPEQVHLTTWPETLLDLSPQELCKAFEEAQREEFCPSVGVLWKSAQRDREAIRNNTFTAMWNEFLVHLRRHKPEWRTAQICIEPPTPENTAGEYRHVPAPVLDVDFEIAIERAYGMGIGEARRAIYMEHPMFGVMQTSEPGLRAASIEKRVREQWMQMGRP